MRQDRVVLVAASWRTNLTPRQPGWPFGVSTSAADRIVDDLGPRLAVKQRRGYRKDTVLIVDGTLVPTRASTDHQVVVDADTCLVVAVGRPVAGDHADCTAWAESGAEAAVGESTTIDDGGYIGTGLVIPHRRERGDEELLAW